MRPHDSCFSQLKNVRRSSENGQLVALENTLLEQRLDALLAMIRNIHGSIVLLVSYFEEYYWL